MKCVIPGEKPDGTQMNTDKHRSYFRKGFKDKKINGTRMNTDTHE